MTCLPIPSSPQNTHRCPDGPSRDEGTINGWSSWSPANKQCAPHGSRSAESESRENWRPCFGVFLVYMSVSGMRDAYVFITLDTGEKTRYWRNMRWMMGEMTEIGKKDVPKSVVCLEAGKLTFETSSKRLPFCRVQELRFLTC